jgi:hypothetical protein
MTLRKTLLTVAVIAPLAVAGVAYASTTTVPSDYSQDVTAGQNQLNADTNAKTQANEAKGSEAVEGQIDDGQVQVDETVGDQESNMGDNQSGETSHDQADSGSSDQSTGSTANSDLTQTRGGASQ